MGLSVTALADSCETDQAGDQQHCSHGFGSGETADAFNLGSRRDAIELEGIDAAGARGLVIAIVIVGRVQIISFALVIFGAGGGFDSGEAIADAQEGNDGVAVRTGRRVAGSEDVS